MIIERARELAVRAPARVVFPDALDERVLKAAHYLQQCGLARPVLVASPFALRQFALSHRMAMDGIQVIDPHSNLSMRQRFAQRWLARAGEKTPPDAVEKLSDPLMFAAAMVSAGEAAVAHTQSSYRNRACRCRRHERHSYPAPGRPPRAGGVTIFSFNVP